MFILARATSGQELWSIEAALLMIGIGLGLNTAPVQNVAVASVPQERAGTASGLVNTARMVGATLGVAVLGLLFAMHSGSSANANAFGPPLVVGGGRNAWCRPRVLVRQRRRTEAERLALSSGDEP